ncbi:MAG: right-handed parallel beta-helix repeat-containing protein [Chthoniobacterales bacterium]
MRVPRCLTRRTGRCNVAGPSAALAFALGSWAMAAPLPGPSLTPPPGPVTPTMKTIDQAQPRIPIDSAHTPGDGDNLFIITTPGSYYLTGSITFSTHDNGIAVRSPGVTIDLNGFEVRRSAGTNGSGIEINETSHGCIVKNGTISGSLDYGVRCLAPAGSYARGGTLSQLSVTGSGMAYALFAGEGWLVEGCKVNDADGNGIGTARGCTLINCSVSNNQELGSSFSNSGIEAGAGSTLTNCTVSRITGENGIFAAAGGTLTNCVASNNTVAYPIRTEERCTLTNCIARDNDSSEFFSYGIATLDECTLTNCTSSGNTNAEHGGNGSAIFTLDNSTVRNCTATSNAGNGIKVYASCQVIDCTVSSNGAYGIRVEDGHTRVTGNSCDDNGFSGIYLLSAGTGDCRIEGNNTTKNLRGIDVDSTGNLILKNSASGNTNVNYDIVANNRYGEIIDITATGTGAVLGNSATSTLTGNHPWANFSY